MSGGIQLSWRMAVLAVCLLALNGCSQRKPSDSASRWKESIVLVEVNRKQFDYFQPWSRQNENVEKMGVVIGPREILTTADRLQNRTLVRVQKHGRGSWWNAEVAWVDYEANLALLSVADDKFWEELCPARMAEPAPTAGTVYLRRWKDGNLEEWKMEISKLSVEQASLSFARYLTLQLTSSIKDGGWSEAVTSDDRLVGITSSQMGDSLTAIPASLVRTILQARRQGSYHGLGYFAFWWQPAVNPATLQHLKEEGNPRGVIVTHIPPWPVHDEVLRPRDVILEVDGFTIDGNGDYLDPQYGYLSFENLAIRSKWAGDSLRMTVLREGRSLEVTYRLPRVDNYARLVPDEEFDRDPEYLIVGGLVLQPLTDAYLKGWGEDWQHRAPFRLVYYNHQEASQERPRIVILSQVLPHDYNLGYQDPTYRCLVIARVNGLPIRCLEDVREALKNPKGEFHVIDLEKGRGPQRIVLDAAGLDAATSQVLKSYGIQKDHVFTSESRRP
jgi:hypothetical protein